MKTVFLIDDDGLMRKMLARLLKKDKHRVRTFASPVGVLDRMAEEKPDLIISDIQMPGMSGLQFLERARREGYRVPVMVMTGFMGPDVVEQARALGVSHIFQKPIKDLSRLRLLVREAMSPPETRGPGGLDQLRLEFLTGMSHELRTPLTAIKLALDGLFSARNAGLDATQSQLLGISQRNVDRIVRMVEKQLALLQITLGDVSVARRLVNLKHLFEGTQKHDPDGERVGRTGDDGERGVYLFTDPERLRTVIHCLLEVVAAADPSGPTYDIDEDDREIVVRFHNRGMSAVSLGDEGDGGRHREGPFGPGGTREFEFRACRCLVESLGGRIDVVRHNGGGEGVQLHLPVLPDYDHTADFVFPVKSLRKAAELSDKRVSFFKCEVRGDGTGTLKGNGNVREFLRRCSVALSEGEVLVRGETYGTYYLALVQRESDELDDIVDFLQRTGDKGNGAYSGTNTVHLQTVAAGELPADDQMPVPEVVC